MEDLGSSPSGRRIEMEIRVSARITFDLSGAPGCVAGRATTYVVLVESSVRTLTCWIRSLSETSDGRDMYLCINKNNDEQLLSNWQIAVMICACEAKYT